MALAVPLVDSSRARGELGWEPTHSATDTLAELIEAMRHGNDYGTRPLTRQTRGPAGVREFLTGVGARS